MEELLANLEILIGSEESVNIFQMCFRALIAFCVLLLSLKLGHKRLLGRMAGLDYFMMIIIGAILSRAINGSAPFYATIGTTFFLVFLHWGLCFLIFRFPFLGNFLKENKRYLIKEGKYLDNELRASHITKDDLLTEMRIRLGREDLEVVREAVLERNGKVSFICEKKVYK